QGRDLPGRTEKGPERQPAMLRRRTRRREHRTDAVLTRSPIDQRGNAMGPQASSMKTLLDQPGLQIMPGCGDGMGASLIEEAGFRTGFISGSSIAAMMLW